MNIASDNPTQISVIIPCRNEEEYIEDCLVSLLGQNGLTGKIEILVVDGMSTDNTRNIVNGFAKENLQIKLLNNPSLFTPHAMNIGIKESEGEYIAILGAHTKYSEDYLAKCINLMNEHPDAICVGGPITSYGNSSFGRATALAMSSKIGVGNAKHRFSDYEGYAEGACFPVFKREVFNQVGLYDENLIRNQDDEFNFRMHKQNLKVYLSHKIKSTYFVRDTPKELFKQYFAYGLWRVVVIKKHRMPRSLRQVVPVSFFMLMFLLILVSPFIPFNTLITSLTLPIIYFLFLVLFGLGLSKNHGLKIGLLFPLSVFIMHFSYALGFSVGIIKIYLFELKIR